MIIATSFQLVIIFQGQFKIHKYFNSFNPHDKNNIVIMNFVLQIKKLR